MIASVQYNDLRGTAAADVSDHCMNSLQIYLAKTFESYDSDRYFCHGCKMWVSERSMVSLSFICLDKIKGKFVSFRPDYYSLENAFELFKRFEVVIGVDINEIEVDENDSLKLE